MHCNLYLKIHSILLVLSVGIVSVSAQDKDNIRHQNDTIRESKITAVQSDKENETQTGHKRLNELDFIYGNVVFSTPDLIKTLQNMPGVNGGTELMSGLYVHGGEGSDNLFTLDGVPMYQISHLGGMFSSFNTDVVSSIDFYKSGFPARYGGRLSSVVDVRTKDGDFEKYHGTFALGLIDGRLQAEGPIIKGKTSFNVAFRRSWMDAVMSPTLKIVNRSMLDEGESVDGTYAFYDLNASITHRINMNHSLSAKVYHGNDRLRLKTVSKEGNVMDARLKWGNTLASLQWKGSFGESFNTETVLYFSQSASDIKYDLLEHNIDEVTDILTIDKVNEKNKSKVNDIGLKSHWHWTPHRNHIVRFGGIVQFHKYAPKRETAVDNTGSVINTSADARYNAVETALYIEDEINVLRGLTVNPGLRYAVFFSDGGAYHSLEPRVALSYKATDFIDIKASYSEMSQFSHLVSTTYMDLPTNCWLPSTQTVKPMRSRQVTAGIYTGLPANFHLNIEGYYKTLKNVLEYSGKNSLFPPLDSWEQSFSRGKGRAYGLETELGWQSTKVCITAYYTLSWSKRKYDGIWYDWFPHRYDNRHKFTLMGNWKVSKTVELYANWNYHTGNLMTVPSHVYNPGLVYDVVYTKPNNVRIPDYHRLDLGANFKWSSKNEKVRHVWNIGIYNVYCRKNIVFVSVEEQDDKSLKGTGRAIFPIIPSFSYTLRF